MDFNQDLEVPDFKSDGGMSRGRNLLGLSDIDVTCDIVDFTFIAKTDDEDRSSKFFLELISWTSKGIEIHIISPIQWLSIMCTQKT